MKSILSPNDDVNFNNFLLQYVKKRLAKKCKVFIKDDEERKYFLDKDSRDYYTPDDIIKSIELNGRMIRFANQKLINYVVYDLSQRFWYEELKHINNIVRSLYFKFVRISKEFELQQRKMSHEKKAPQRSQGAKQ